MNGQRTDDRTTGWGSASGPLLGQVLALSCWIGRRSWVGFLRAGLGRLLAVAMYQSVQNKLSVLTLAEWWLNISTALYLNSVKVGQPLVKLATRYSVIMRNHYNSNEVPILMKVRLFCPLIDRRRQAAWQDGPCSWSFHLIIEQSWAEPSGHRCQNSWACFLRVVSKSFTHFRSQFLLTFPLCFRIRGVGHIKITNNDTSRVREVNSGLETSLPEIVSLCLLPPPTAFPA